MIWYDMILFSPAEMPVTPLAPSDDGDTAGEWAELDLVGVGDEAEAEAAFALGDVTGLSSSSSSSSPSDKRSICE